MKSIDTPTMAKRYKILPAAALSILTIVLCFISCTDHNDAGDDAYDLWLKYKKVDNPALLKKYRQAPELLGTLLFHLYPIPWAAKVFL